MNRSPASRPTASRPTARFERIAFVASRAPEAIAAHAALTRRYGDAAPNDADVIVALGTNGPITDTDFNDMMSILGGASRVVFVNVHVDRPWQDPNNAVLANGATRYPNVVVADWATLAAQNPQWFGADGTHLAIDGSGADALASLVASTLSNG